MVESEARVSGIVIFTVILVVMLIGLHDGDDDNDEQ
jgi:hypothetical protein